MASFSKPPGSQQDRAIVVQVSALANPGFLVEIEATAAR
jgi:enamine deaminase RidA (YjgF/YER057c/UK114 family)